MSFSRSTCPDVKASRWPVLGLQPQDYWEGNLQQPEQRTSSLWSQDPHRICHWRLATSHPQEPGSLVLQNQDSMSPILPLPESNRSPTGGKKRDFSPCQILEKQEVTQKKREHRQSQSFKKGILNSSFQIVTVQSQMTWVAFFFFREAF